MSAIFSIYETDIAEKRQAEGIIDPRVAICLLTWVVLITIDWFTKLDIDWSSFAIVFKVCGFLLCISYFYNTIRPNERLSESLFSVVVLVLFSNAAELLSYQSLCLHFPAVDSQMHELDKAMGLDWWTYTTALTHAPLISYALSFAYLSALPQMALATVFLGLTGRLEKLRRMTLAFILCIVAAILVWAIFPTFGVLELFYSQGIKSSPASIILGDAYAREMLQLAGGHIPVLTPSTLNGIISFPSIHAVWAVLMIYSFHGVGWIGLIGWILNITMLVAIPAEGSHHFMDVFSGVALAVAALALVTTRPFEWRKPVKRAFDVTDHAVRSEAESIAR